ncbi:hypothetical protein CHS0354_004445 [Potamilus streckersoni]|uniref:Uncharacterized protein n=1 Tax=Potamilus streckersoni TaxID=2493646 RepID=A0AAE0SNG0_9BIVA|nr:hypothetical protein CHS0354_004445 [Potamilus streckersoni]
MEDIFLYMKSEGKLYNLARLKAKTKIPHIQFKELLFADHTVLGSLCSQASRNGSHMQRKLAPNDMGWNATSGQTVAGTTTQFQRRRQCTEQTLSIKTVTLETGHVILLYTILGDKGDTVNTREFLPRATTYGQMPTTKAN